MVPERARCSKANLHVRVVNHSCGFVSYFLTASCAYIVKGQCMASKMYVDQLKDVLVHSTSKKVAGFIAEPIQVRTVLYSISSSWRRGGLMVNALFSGWSAPGLSPGQGHCVVFLGKTLNSHSASLHPGV